MPNYPGIDNPKGAFGYATTANTAINPKGFSPFRNPVIETVRNLSTLRGLVKGQTVIWGYTTSTASGVADPTTSPDGVYATTVLGHPNIAGICITSCGVRTTGTTLNTGPAPAGEYAQIVTWGPWYGALATSGATGGVAGEWAVNGVSTVSEGATAANGGFLTGYRTASFTTAAGLNGLIGIVGTYINTPSTGTSGYLTTAGLRAGVFVNPHVVSNPTLSTA